jgi:hypothetical protein
MLVLPQDVKRRACEELVGGKLPWFFAVEHFWIWDFFYSTPMQMEII